MKLNDIARKFGYTGQVIRNLVDQGFIPKPPPMKEGKGGDYDFEATALGLIAYLRKRLESGEAARNELAQSRAKAFDEQRAFTKEKRLMKSGKLLPIEVVEQVWTARKAATRQVVEQLPLSKKQKDEVLEEMEASGVKEYLK